MPNEAYTLPIGKARVVTEGTDLTVVAWGAWWSSSEGRRESDASIELIDLRTISPLDEDTILASVEKQAAVCLPRSTSDAWFGLRNFFSGHRTMLPSLGSPCATGCWFRHHHALLQT